MKKINSILVIDSDPVSSYMSKNFFSKIGLGENLYFTKNGKEALRFIDLHFLPELILLDFYNPIMHGLEFIEQLNQKGMIQNTKLIFYSPTTEHNFITGSINVIDKPLTYEKFCMATGLAVN